MTEKTITGTEHAAFARGMNLAISTKQSVEICNLLRYKSTAFAKDYLERVSQLAKPVPFRRFNRDTGHKPGMAAGRYPQKAAQQFISLIKSVEANAQVKGLNVTNLKIIKLVANRAAVPLRGGRQQHGGRRTHVEIAVTEFKGNSKKEKGKSSSQKGSTKPQQVSTTNVKTNKKEASQ